MPFKKRLLIFLSLWLILGAVFAVFCEGDVEAGQSELFERMKLFYQSPFVSATGVAFTLVHREGSGSVDEEWRKREANEAVVAWAVLAILAGHAVIALTRSSKRQFIVLTAIQVTLFVIIIPCVLYFYHYENTHGHG